MHIMQKMQIRCAYPPCSASTKNHLNFSSHQLLSVLFLWYCPYHKNMYSPKCVFLPWFHDCCVIGQPPRKPRPFEQLRHWKWVLGQTQPFEEKIDRFTACSLLQRLQEKADPFPCFNQKMVGAAQTSKTQPFCGRLCTLWEPWLRGGLYSTRLGWKTINCDDLGFHHGVHGNSSNGAWHTANSRLSSPHANDRRPRSPLLSAIPQDSNFEDGPRKKLPSMPSSSPNFLPLDYLDQLVSAKVPIGTVLGRFSCPSPSSCCPASELHIFHWTTLLKRNA